MPLAGLSLLIVDDERLIRENLRDFFQDLGAKVWDAGSGEQGLEILGREAVDVCTVDIRLPGMTGNEFVLKAHELRPGLKFIIHTGTSVYDIPKALRALGIRREFVIKKPASDGLAFVQAIKSLTGREP